METLKRNKDFYGKKNTTNKVLLIAFMFGGLFLNTVSSDDDQRGNIKKIECNSYTDPKCVILPPVSEENEIIYRGIVEGRTAKCIKEFNDTDDRDNCLKKIALFIKNNGSNEKDLLKLLARSNSNNGQKEENISETGFRESGPVVFVPSKQEEGSSGGSKDSILVINKKSSNPDRRLGRTGKENKNLVSVIKKCSITENKKYKVPKLISMDYGNEINGYVVGKSGYCNFNVKGDCIPFSEMEKHLIQSRVCVKSYFLSIQP